MGRSKSPKRHAYTLDVIVDKDTPKPLIERASRVLKVPGVLDTDIGRAQLNALFDIR